MDRGQALSETRTVRSRDAEPGGKTGPTTAGFVRWIGRFVIASTLVMVGSMLALTGAITVVGLPLGLIVVGIGLELLRPAKRRS